MSLRGHVTAVAAALAIVSMASSVRAQGDLTGHWKGTVVVQAMHVSFDVDIARNARGELAGTIGLPSQEIKGLPLQQIAVDGTAVTFFARQDQPFRGALAADGTIAGDMTVEGLTAPFTMTRTGDASIEASPRSAGIDSALAGTWAGALQAGGRTLRLTMTIERQSDGTMVAEMTDVDEGGLRSPLKLAQNGSTLNIESVAVPASISGTLNPGATELSGTFKQGQTSLPLRLHRTER